jgi:hypothetical protein
MERSLNETAEVVWISTPGIDAARPNALTLLARQAGTYFFSSFAFLASFVISLLEAEFDFRTHDSIVSRCF